jgi:hypothetical protein
MARLFCGVVTGLLWTHSQPAFAQAAAVEWSSVAKITNGTCGDNATAHVSERLGKMHLRLVYPNGQQYAEFDIALAADGSGKTEFKGNAGAPTILEVPAGTGKRPMKTSQVTGICQWAWTPK